ncbi:hypothetical protein RCL1_006418 [Eukaryota sp. TZLM3-RCL]
MPRISRSTPFSLVFSTYTDVLSTISEISTEDFQSLVDKICQCNVSESISAICSCLCALFTNFKHQSLDEFFWVIINLFDPCSNVSSELSHSLDICLVCFINRFLSFDIGYLPLHMHSYVQSVLAGINESDCNCGIFSLLLKFLQCIEQFMELQVENTSELVCSISFKPFVIPEFSPSPPSAPSSLHFIRRISSKF